MPGWGAELADSNHQKFRYVAGEDRLKDLRLFSLPEDTYGRQDKSTSRKKLVSNKGE